MKKIISIILVVSMLILSTVTVFAVDTEAETVSYDLSELFKDYHEYSLDEMIEFINENPYVYSFVEYLRTEIGNRTYIFAIHFAGEYIRSEHGSKLLNNTGFSDNMCEYLYPTFRVMTPDVGGFRDLLGEKGNKCFHIQFMFEFVEYINSVDYIEGNRLILNFLMNLLRNEEVVGFSWSIMDIQYGNSNCKTFNTFISGDCNADSLINGADGYLIKKAILGFDDGIDPLAVDMNDDGQLNAKDSLAVKRKIIIG